MAIMRTMILLGLAAAMTGCATTPVPADKLARASAAIRSAEEVNAPAYPGAALHLRLAREELAQAMQILQDGDHGRAQFVLLRAEADAEAAMNLAREVSARTEAEKTLENVRQAKAQMEGPRT
jgi:uncharacterized protein DUF4398